MSSRSPLPPRQAGPAAWVAADMADPSEWTWELDRSDIDELIRVSAPLADLPHDTMIDGTDSITLSPELMSSLQNVHHELVAGRGFQLISALPVDELSEGHAAAAFITLGSAIGLPRSQNASGDLLGHVRDVGKDATDPEARIYQTSDRQTFHTDSTDVVGLLCLSDAASGGDSLLVSTAAIYNEMLDTDAELAALLFEPIATDRRGEVPDGEEPFFLIPVLNWFDGTLTGIYQRQYIDSAQRFEAAPQLSSKHVEALDLFDEIANRPEMHLSMRLRPGDMQFVHNHSTLHDRTSFVDGPHNPRHLLRLWLSVVDDRKLPPIFASRYGSVTVGDRGGIIVGR